MLELKEFQEVAVRDLHDKVRGMVRGYYGDGRSRGGHVLSWTGLHSLTGSGKTVMFAETISRLMFGDRVRGIAADERASVLFVADSPDLIEQTRRCLVRHSPRFSGVRRDGPVVVRIENDFCDTHSRLSAGHVYLLSRSLLVRTGNLVRGGEASGGATFWDVLDQTTRDERTHLVMCVDEAHQGFGRKVSRDELTVVDRLVDGVGGRLAMPVVVGMTATKERFVGAMSRRGDRVGVGEVVVPPADIRESGLLKGFVNVHTPDGTRDGAEHQLMNAACKMFVKVCDEWGDWCVAHGIDDVSPLFLVQVPDSVSDARLEEICDQISRNVDFLDPAVSFAHTFGEHEARVAGRFRIAYVRPEDADGAKHVRVLLAKEAISNGWNCPRNEVLFSYRVRKDKTYIAQLIGRGLRSVLAERVEGSDLLNSIHCYLPFFDTDNVADVAREIRDGFDGTDAAPEVIIRPTVVAPAKPAPLSPDERKAAMVRKGRGRSHRGDAPCSHGEALGTCVDTIVSQVEVTDRHADASGACADDDAPEAAAASTCTSSSHATDPAPVAVTDDGGPTLSGASPELEEAGGGEPDLNGRDLSFSVEDWDAMRTLFECVVCLRRIRGSLGGASDSGAYAYERLLTVARFMVETNLRPSAYDDCCKAFARQVDREFEDHEVEFKEGMAKVRRFNGVMSQIDIDSTIVADDDAAAVVSHVSESSRADLYTVRLSAASAGTYYAEDCLNEYRRCCALKDLGEYEVECRIAALRVCPGIRKSLGDWANMRTKDMLGEAWSRRVELTSAQAGRLNELRRMIQVHSGVPLTWPSECVVSGEGDLYEHHIIQREDGLFPLRLLPFERQVLQVQEGLPGYVGFYRNPSSGNRGNSTMSIPWRDAESHNRTMHPDFLIFKRDGDGKVVLSVLDPHGDHLADAIPKMKAWVSYLERANEVSGTGTYGDAFFEVLMPIVTDTKTGEVRCLDLADEVTREAVKALPVGGSLMSLYRGEHSFSYPPLRR